MRRWVETRSGPKRQARVSEKSEDARMAYADIRIEAPEAFITKESSAADFYRIGLVYSEGLDVAVDLVSAHKFFNLAATRGHREAKMLRQEMAEMMSQPEVLKAQRAAREWMKKAN